MPHTNNKHRKKPNGIKNARTSASKSFSPSPKLSSGPLKDIPRPELNALIREYHTLEKLKKASKDENERKSIEEKQAKLGGLEMYQLASLHGGDKNRGGESSKWLVKTITELEIYSSKPSYTEYLYKMVNNDGLIEPMTRPKLRILDVGAISGTAYKAWSWLETTSIDLNPLAADVLKYNFFDFPIPEDEEDKFDIVSLSLVINFEGDLSKRGLMLQHAHNYLYPNGYLYIVLPLPCIENSRYLTTERFEGILKTTGWTTVAQHDSSKLTYWLVQRTKGTGIGDDTVWKKEEIRRGVKHNNFCILVNK